jgi:hypothetical protein
MRRGEGAPPEPGAPTEIADPAAASAQAAPTPDAPTTDPATAAFPAEATDPATTPPGATADAEAVPADVLPDEPTPGFVERGRLRRRLRYVRRAREVALRDLGGLVFDLHRFGRERTDLVDQKLTALATLDGEMRTLETALDERREITVLREPGLASCPRCGALHASDAAYCSACGLPVGRGASLPTGPSLTGSAGPATTAPPTVAALTPGSPAEPANAAAAAPPANPSAPDDTATAPPAKPAAPDDTVLIRPGDGDPEAVEALTARHAAGAGSTEPDEPPTTPS